MALSNGATMGLCNCDTQATVLHCCTATSKQSCSVAVVGLPHCNIATLTRREPRAGGPVAFVGTGGLAHVQRASALACPKPPGENWPTPFRRAYRAGSWVKPVGSQSSGSGSQRRPPATWISGRYRAHELVERACAEPDMSGVMVTPRTAESGDGSMEARSRGSGGGVVHLAAAGPGNTATAGSPADPAASSAAVP